jgi:4-hydroxy-tetrahydrodipicolinate synthase
MPTFQPGLVHTPVTPFKGDRQIDFDTYGKLLEFHLRHGAQTLALPMHAGESVSLGDAEQQALLDFAIRQIKGRAPVIAHVSDSGTGIAAMRAKRAEASGAAAVVATTPYYWTPPPAMVLEHFAQIGAAVRVPFYVFYTPQEMGGTKLSTDLILKLIQRLDNFAGVIDASLDWQFMINIISNAQRVRPAFQLVSGTEYMISAGAIGATGMFSPLAGIAPKLVGELYALCRKEQYDKARPAQEAAAALRQAVKKAGVAGLKGAMRAMGRDCGQPRPPLDALNSADYERIAAALGAMPALGGEPRNW